MFSFRTHLADMSGRQTGFVTDEMTALRSILASNGFGAAAANLRMGELGDNIRDTIRMWKEYPTIMERYPLHLSKRTDRVRENARQNDGRFALKG